MGISKRPGCLKPLLAILGTIVLFSYGAITLISQDPFWFLSTTVMPDPQRVVIRVDGVETVLTAPGSAYDLVVERTREALTAFKNWAPGSMGLSEPTLAEYQT